MGRRKDSMLGLRGNEEMGTKSQHFRCGSRGAFCSHNASYGSNPLFSKTQIQFPSAQLDCSSEIGHA